MPVVQARQYGLAQIARMRVDTDGGNCGGTDKSRTAEKGD